MRGVVAVAAVLLIGACSPRNDAGIKAEEPASAPAEPPAPSAAVAPTAAATPAPLDPAFAGNIDARGTEPFWGVQVRAGKLTLTRPDHPDVSAPDAGAKMEGDAAVFGDAGLRLTLKKAACSDGMSDNEYPLMAEVQVGSETLKGCAAPA